MTKTVVVLPGEDAAPEAMEPSIALLERMGLPIRWSFPLVGEAAMRQSGDPFPDSARAAIDAADATLFGATSGASARALFYLRWGKQTYANVRPLRWSKGFCSSLADPSGIDLVLVRENLEDLYLYAEGEIAELAPLSLHSLTAGKRVDELGEGSFAIKAITRRGSERVIRYAFEVARRRKAAGRPGHLTLGAKWNMLPRTDGLFREVGAAIASEYPDVKFETLLIDDLAHRLTARPASFDVLVMPNLYGDVLSDAAAGLVGGLGLAPSGCYGDDYAYFESAHGTAPDLVGRHVINPTATLLSASMMLEYLGFADAAAAIERAVRAAYAEGTILTPDQGGTATTGRFCDAVEANLR
ncbi:MAG TPA: isocitrate/isopropylmalate family dehydrogenase [Candidatus Binatia bacterium]